MDSTASYINYILSFLQKKIVIPQDFHAQVQAIEVMLGNDVSGLVDSLTDFSVNSATVDYTIITKNDNLNEILKKWLDNINISYGGEIPIGITSLSKEYFKERWKGGSFPILKIKWAKYKGLQLPMEMFFVDGGSIYAQDKEEGNEISLLNYDYYIGKNTEKKYKLSGNNTIISRPYGRWFDKYPTPFLIKRGVLYNWKIINSIKNKEIEILDQIIPYMLLVKKGTEGLAIHDKKVYKDSELKEVKRKFQKLLDDLQRANNNTTSKKTPIRTTNFDEEIDHIIPNIKNLFEPALFESADKAILTGLGFIDIAEGVSSSRRESILNPKAFIEEVKVGVDDFKQLLYQLVLKIIEKNESNKKYMNVDFFISSSPVRGFMTDKFKQLVRLLWKGGKISNQTAVEIIAEVDFRTEVMRTKKEQEEDIEELMYPRITENREGQGIDLPGKDKETDKNGRVVPEDKKGDEKKNFDLAQCSKCEYKFDYLSIPESGMGWVKCPECGETVTQKDLEIAPYKNTNDLPKRVKDNMTSALARTWLKVFNEAYNTYGNDKQASKVAWGLISKIARKNKEGRWVKVSARIKINKAMIEEVMEGFEEDVMDEVGNKMLKEELEKKNLHIAQMKEQLLKQLLNPNKDK